jgi:hypothetical protein
VENPIGAFVVLICVPNLDCKLFKLKQQSFVCKGLQIVKFNLKQPSATYQFLLPNEKNEKVTFHFQYKPNIVCTFEPDKN